MFRWCFVISAPLAMIAACRAHVGPTPSVPSSASTPLTSADNRTAEYEVYAAVLAQLEYEVEVAAETHVAWTCDPPSPFICDGSRIPAEFTHALQDYQQKSAVSAALPRSPTPSRRVAPWRVPRGEDARCWPKPVASLSRVGFSPDGTHAVMSYSESTGPGPHPGCGYSAGRFLLLRRTEQGEWRIAAVAGGWIT